MTDDPDTTTRTNAAAKPGHAPVRRPVLFWSLAGVSFLILGAAVVRLSLP